jgi:hypothetical protein
MTFFSQCPKNHCGQLYEIPSCPVEANSAVIDVAIPIVHVRLTFDFENWLFLPLVPVFREFGRNLIENLKIAG